MRFVNLTPHTLNIRKADGSVIDLPPSGEIARVAEIRHDAGEIDGISVSVASYGDVTGLPEPSDPQVAYIVSALVLARVPHREDVFAPGVLLRDEAGRPIGCDGLSATPARLRQPASR